MSIYLIFKRISPYLTRLIERLGFGHRNARVRTPSYEGKLWYFDIGPVDTAQKQMCTSEQGLQVIT